VCQSLLKIDHNSFKNVKNTSRLSRDIYYTGNKNARGMAGVADTIVSNTVVDTTVGQLGIRNHQVACSMEKHQCQY